ncbi:MAG: alkaline phosphatase family protein, partial [Candidatus Acidiferrales bacterium]
MLKRNVRWLTAIILAANLVVALPASLFADQGQGGKNPAGKYRTTTPIKHIVIIFQENESFDHYFGTYPNATNPKGETRFNTRPGTPS